MRRLNITCPALKDPPRRLFCRDNGMYYGGDPPAWTTMPEIPPEALFTASGSAASTEGEKIKMILPIIPRKDHLRFSGGGPQGITSGQCIHIASSEHNQPVALTHMRLTLSSLTDAGPAPAAQKSAATRPAGASGARPAKHAHPLQTLGGYQMPTHGRIGGQKGVGAVEPATQASVKRKRDDTGEARSAGTLQ